MLDYEHSSDHELGASTDSQPERPSDPIQPLKVTYGYHPEPKVVSMGAW